MEKKRFTKDELISWAKNAAGSVIISISLLNGVDTINNTFEFEVTSPSVLFQVASQDESVLPDGQYMLNIDSNNSNEEDLPYDQFAMCIGFNAALNDGKRTPIGTLDKLIFAISEFERLVRIDKSNPAYVIGHAWITLPENPSEIERLRDLLAENAMSYAFPDGSGTLNLGNLKMGKGIYA